MKLIHLNTFILVLTLSPVLLMGQQKIKLGENRTSEGTILVRKSPSISENPTNTILVTDSSSDKIIAVHRKNSSVLQYPNSIRYSKKFALHAVFLNVLGEQRIKELSGNVLVKLFYNKTGKIIAVEFFTENSTELSAEEFEDLTKAIKRDITFIISYKENDKKFVPYSHAIHFRKLLSQIGSLTGNQ